MDIINVIRRREQVQIKRQRLFTKRRRIAVHIIIHHSRWRIATTVTLHHRRSNPASNFNPRVQITRPAGWLHRTAQATGSRPVKIFKLVLPIRRQKWKIGFRFRSMEGACGIVVSTCSILRRVKGAKPDPSFFYRVSYLGCEPAPLPFTDAPITIRVGFRVSKSCGCWSISLRIFPTGHGKVGGGEEVEKRKCALWLLFGFYFSFLKMLYLVDTELWRMMPIVFFFWLLISKIKTKILFVHKNLINFWKKKNQVPRVKKFLPLTKF